MEIWAMVVSTIVGGMSAWVIVDFSHRRKAMEQILTSKAEFEEIIKSMQVVHNELSAKVIDIEGRLMTHDFQFNAKAKR